MVGLGPIICFRDCTVWGTLFILNFTFGLRPRGFCEIVGGENNYIQLSSRDVLLFPALEGVLSTCTPRLLDGHNR